MNLVKWFRKNKTKVMAVVVIVILVGFIGGSALSYLLSPETTIRRKPIAYFGNNGKITNYDLGWARRELDILRMVRAEDLLRSQDIQGILLAELLFSDVRAAPAVINYIKQTIRARRYRISDEQIANIYKRSMLSDIYWLLLREEAERAGIRMSNEDVGRLLARVIPQLFGGATYRQLIGALVNQRGIAQEQILATVGKLLAVLQYAQIVCSAGDVTNAQLRHLVSWEGETINVEFLKIDAAAFSESQDRPGEEEMIAHFDQYKEFSAGDLSEDNPYGFGYRLPDRVQLEYVAVKLDDVSSIVKPPTPQETEEYYQKNAEQFTESVPSDPNDPNSPTVERTRSYADVASTISEQLKRNRIRLKAESILQEARTLTEAGLQDLDRDIEDLSVEELKQKAGKYQTAVEQLSNKHTIQVYWGQTGLLSTADMRTDEYLGRLFVMGYGYNPVPLTQVVFSVEGLEVGAAELLSVPRPRLYENVGPVRDMAGEIMAVVRVIKAEKASEPESIDYTFSKDSMVFEQQPTEPNEVTAEEKKDSAAQTYSTRERVMEDLKKLSAMDTARRKAEEFVTLVAENGWDGALGKFNDLYRQETQSEPNQPVGLDLSDPNKFRLESLTNLRRIPRTTLETIAVQCGPNPEERTFVPEARNALTVKEAQVESRFVEKLYSLARQDSNAVDTTPVSFEFKPHMSFYVVKNISVDRLEQQEYEQIKAARAQQQEYIQSQSLAAVHFNPENIVKRMNFRPAGQSEESSASQTQAESEESL